MTKDLAQRSGGYVFGFCLVYAMTMTMTVLATDGLLEGQPLAYR